MKRLTGIALTLVWLMGVPVSAGDVPQLMNFQGRLDDTMGAPVPDSTYSITFRIYDDPTAGAVLWQETQNATTFNGVFSVLLGTVTPIPSDVFDADSCYLEVHPDGFDPIVPRARLTSVAYSRRAEIADSIKDINIADLEESFEIDDKIATHQLISNAHHSKTVDAGELITGTLSEARLPQKSIDSTEVEDGSIGSRQLADEPGLSHSFIGVKSLPTTVTVLDSGFIVAPEFGYVLTIASGWFYVQHIGTDVSATLSLSTSKTGGHDTEHTARFEVRGPAPMGNTVENFTIQKVNTVTKGQSFKIYLLGSRSTTGFPTIENVHINVLYFPTSYGEIDIPNPN
ncbi:MAG: hypothetical protein Kow0074_25230 [Candidatus Zixiibacteriota bacterium]